MANYNENQIKSISIGGTIYEGENISVSPNNRRLNIEIVTNKNFVLDYQTFITNLQTTYGSNVIMMSSNPVTDEVTGETTYKFNMDVSVIKDLEDNQLPLSLSIKEDNSNNGDNSLWLYIAIPAAVVVIAGVVIFIIIRRRRGGGRRKGGKEEKEEKKSSYKDYYI